jgi:SAM-dependent methyltransferase
MNRKERRANRRLELRDAAVRDRPAATTAELITLAARHNGAGRHAEAVKLLRQVLGREPAHAAAHDTMAVAYQGLGRPDDAVRHFQQAISFGLLGVEALVKQSPAMMVALTEVEAIWPRPLPLASLVGPRDSVADDALLLALLKTRTVADLELERFLTAARRAFLTEAATNAAVLSDRALTLCCALAQQCFLNEYVFAFDEGERAAAGSLAARLVEALAASSDVPVALPALVACYRPLHALPGAERLASRRWPGPLDEVLARQLREPLQDRSEAAAVPALTAIEDETSRQVQQQYEQSPYPRWSVPQLVGPMTIDAHLRERFALPASWRPPDGDDFLIAGCGTGEHALEVARRFPQSRILAIDLSRPSLGYARRRTREMGIGNIDYAQADILRLGSIGRLFDVIEAVGVLHHLSDPEAGWRILLSLLRPGGLMRIGLYSELGRRQLQAARALIRERGYGPTADDIRAWRQELIQRGQFVRSSDFFSISGCRDLCFNVMEHAFTLPRIKSFLDGHGLTLLGMEVSAETLGEFLQANPEPDARRDLDRWHAFEQAQPRTFEAMYGFWVGSGAP